MLFAILGYLSNFLTGPAAIISWAFTAWGVWGLYDWYQQPWVQACSPYVSIIFSILSFRYSYYWFLKLLPAWKVPAAKKIENAMKAATTGAFLYGGLGIMACAYFLVFPPGSTEIATRGERTTGQIINYFVGPAHNASSHTLLHELEKKRKRIAKVSAADADAFGELLDKHTQAFTLLTDNVLTNVAYAELNAIWTKYSVTKNGELRAKTSPSFLDKKLPDWIKDNFPTKDGVQAGKNTLSDKRRGRERTKKKSAPRQKKQAGKKQVEKPKPTEGEGLSRADIGKKVLGGLLLAPCIYYMAKFYATEAAFVISGVEAGGIQKASQILAGEMLFARWLPDAVKPYDLAQIKQRIKYNGEVLGLVALKMGVAGCAAFAACKVLKTAFGEAEKVLQWLASHHKMFLRELMVIVLVAIVLAALVDRPVPPKRAKAAQAPQPPQAVQLPPDDEEEKKEDDDEISIPPSPPQGAAYSAFAPQEHNYVHWEAVAVPTGELYVHPFTTEVYELVRYCPTGNPGFDVYFTDAKEEEAKKAAMIEQAMEQIDAGWKQLQAWEAKLERQDEAKIEEEIKNERARLNDELKKATKKNHLEDLRAMGVPEDELEEMREFKAEKKIKNRLKRLPQMKKYKQKRSRERRRALILQNFPDALIQEQDAYNPKFDWEAFEEEEKQKKAQQGQLPVPSDNDGQGDNDSQGNNNDDQGAQGDNDDQGNNNDDSGKFFTKKRKEAVKYYIKETIRGGAKGAVVFGGAVAIGAVAIGLVGPQIPDGAFLKTKVPGFNVEIGDVVIAGISALYIKEGANREIKIAQARDKKKKTQANASAKK